MFRCDGCGSRSYDKDMAYALKYYNRLSRSVDGATFDKLRCLEDYVNRLPQEVIETLIDVTVFLMAFQSVRDHNKVHGQYSSLLELKTAIQAIPNVYQ